MFFMSGFCYTILDPNANLTHHAKRLNCKSSSEIRRGFPPGSYFRSRIAADKSQWLMERWDETDRRPVEDCQLAVLF
jgi:hypothetical protein